VISHGDERTALRAAGDADGLLPYTLVPAKAGGQAACATWRGRLTRSTIQRLLRHCS
jgi:hypothetical protein